MRAAALLLVLAACEQQAAKPKPAPEPAPVADAQQPAATRPPEPVSAWPYVAWDHAEAVTFNPFPGRRGVPLRVVDDKGWSPHVTRRLPITREQAQRALDLLAVTEGELLVSKCPFPRHAIVLFAGDTAVASANVCFECGDILTWPAWRDGTGDHEALFAAYQKVFPTWEAFFRDELKLSITPPKK